MAQRRFCFRLILSIVSFFLANANSLAYEKGVPILQTGHTENIGYVFFTADSRVAVSAASDHTIRVWDVQQGREIRSISAPVSGYRDDVAMSSDGKQFALFVDAANEKKAIRRWDLASGEELKVIPVGDAERILYTADSSGIIVQGGDKILRLYDLSTGKMLRRFDAVAGETIAVSPDGKYIAATMHSNLRIWDFATGRVIKNLKINYGSESLATLEFNANSSLLLFNVLSGIKLWKVADWTDAEFPVKASYSVGRFAADPNILITAGLKTVNMYDLTKQQAIMTPIPVRTGAGSFKNKFAVSRDGRYALQADEYKGLRLYNLREGVEAKMFGSDLEAIHALSLSTDDRYLATGGGTYRGDNNYPKGAKGRVWDLHQAALVTRFAADRAPINSLQFSADGQEIASGDGEMISTITGKTLRKLNNMYGAQAISMSANAGRVLSLERTIGSSDYPDLLMHDARTGELLRRFQSQPTEQLQWKAVVISPDGNRALLGAQTSDYQQWGPPLALMDLNSGKVLRYFDTAAKKSYEDRKRVLAMSSDGRFGLLNMGPDFKLWDLNTGKLLQVFKATPDISKTNHVSLNSLQFSRDGSRIVAGYYNGNIALWDTASAKVLQVFEGHVGAVVGVTLSSDGNRIYSASGDATVRVWDVTSGKELLKMVAFNDGEWIAITPEGYFNASAKGAERLNLVTGPLSVTSVDSFYEAFYRPDIVASVLRGAKLETSTSIAQTKPAPLIEFVNAPQRSAEATVMLTLKITDQGGGIGDIRVYRNGSAISLESQDGSRGLIRLQSSPQNEARPQIGRVITRQYRVKLDAGVNQIRVLAFEAKNQARSEYADWRIDVQLVNATRPTLHALVFGIDEYRNPKLSLRFAAADANLFSETISHVGVGLFDSVKVTKLTTREETTREAIAAAITRMGDIGPNDLFVFYVASHGTVDDGNYYLITSNVGSVSSNNLKVDALSQVDLTRLLANVPTSKKLVVLDTCNSGALGNALQTSMLTRGMSEDTAVKVLSRAVGSTILSAATSTQEALEGYQGHGLFSYVLAEGLSGKADTNKDGFVTTSELSGYIDEMVPKLAQKIFGKEQFPTVNNGGQIFPLGRVQ